VDSVLNQTRLPDEVIVYDDGSTDDSLPVLRSYGDRIKVIEGVHGSGRTPLQYQANAIHRAFLACSGDHVYLLDGDDCFLPDKISRYEEAWALAPEATLVQASVQLIDVQGAVIRSGYQERKHPRDSDYRAATYQWQDPDLYYPTSALAFSRDFLSKMLPVDFSDKLELAADIRLAMLAPFYGPVRALPEGLTSWRQRGNSMSRESGQRTLYLNTLKRCRYFNNYANKAGVRPIRLWLNARFYRQWARRFLPDWVSRPFVRMGA